MKAFDLTMGPPFLDKFPRFWGSIPAGEVTLSQRGEAKGDIGKKVTKNVKKK